MSGGRFSPAKYPERRCLPVALWPVEDQCRWMAACTAGSILDEDLGAAANLRMRSRYKAEKGYGRWLTYLQYYEPDCMGQCLEARITRQRVVAYVRHLQAVDNSSATILCRLQELGDVGRLLAGGEDFSFINQIASRIRATHQPARPKRERLMGDQIVQLGYDLMRSVATLNGVEAAVRYRDGLMLALLVHIPLRRKNFADLRIGETLIARQGQWFITLTPEETKTHAYYEAVLHTDLVHWLNTYLAQYRPMLKAQTGRWYKPSGSYLWLSVHGSPLTEMAIYDRVRKQTMEAFGIAINPHQFRDILASTIASHAPAHTHAAAPLLGHASLQTTEKYYRIAKAQEGHKRYIRTVQGMRGNADG